MVEIKISAMDFISCRKLCMIYVEAFLHDGFEVHEIMKSTVYKSQQRKEHECLWIG